MTLMKEVRGKAEEIANSRRRWSYASFGLFVVAVAATVTTGLDRGSKGNDNRTLKTSPSESEISVESVEHLYTGECVSPFTPCGFFLTSFGLQSRVHQMQWWRLINRFVLKLGTH